MLGLRDEEMARSFVPKYEAHADKQGLTKFGFEARPDTRGGAARKGGPQRWAIYAFEKEKK